MITTQRTLLSLALAAAVSAPMANADDGFQLSEKLSVTGFIDMSWVYMDTDAGSDQGAGLDQFEIDLLYKFDSKFSAQVDLEHKDDGDDVDLEQAFLTYQVNDAVSIKAGRFLSYSGWETEEPTGLFQYSGTGYAPIFYGYYQQGVSAMYKGNGFALAASVINDLDNPEATDSERPAYELMAAFMPSDSVTVKAFYSSDKLDGANVDKEKFNIWGSYAEGPLTLAVELNTAENSYMAGTESDGYLLMGNYDFGSFGLTVRYHAWETEDSTGSTIIDADGITISPSVAISDNLLMVFEYRMDDVNGVDVDTLAVEALVTF